MGILDLETLLPKILDKSFELLPADRGVILLMENGQLQPKYVKYKTRSWRTSRFRYRTRS